MLIELNTVKKTPLDLSSSNRIILEISVDEKYASNIEIVEDAFGDEVYYNYVKFNRDLITTNISDEERM